MGVVGLWSGSTACSMPLQTQVANALGHIRSSVAIRSQTLAQDKIRTELVEHLLDVFAHTQDPDTIYAILQDLCTVREITEMSQRLEVARLLSEGASYLDIQEQTGASATPSVGSPSASTTAAAATGPRSACFAAHRARSARLWQKKTSPDGKK